MSTLIAKNSVTRRYLKRGELIAKRRSEERNSVKADAVSDRVQQALRAPNWRQPKEETGGACLPQAARETLSTGKQNGATRHIGQRIHQVGQSLLHGYT